MENANPPYYRPQNSPTLNDILMFKQHEDEPIYDAWARFKYLLRKVPHHNFDLWSQIEIFYHRVDHYTKMDIDHTADGDLWGLSADKAWETIENCARLAKKMDNPKSVVTDQLIASLREQARRLFGDKTIDEITGHTGLFDFTTIQAEHIGNPDKMEDRVENLNPPSTPQVPPSFEAPTPPVTYPEEVEETLGIPIEVEPLDQAPLEDIGLNTCNDNLTPSSREVPSFDETEPQPKPLPNLPSLDENLGIKKGPDPPIKPYSPGSFTLKVVDPKPCREEANIGVEHNLTCLHHPFMSDHKKHYGFKPGLFGQDGFPTRSLLKLIENDPFLGENLNPPTNPIELGKVMMIGAHPFERIIHPPLFPHVAYFHPKGVYHYFHPHLILSVGKTSHISVK